MILLAQEAPVHRPAREALLDRCFGPARHLKTCEKLRRGQRPAQGLAFAATDGETLVGTIRLWHVQAGSAGPALLLGPLAVAPERQGEAIGTLLMHHALDEAARLGHRAVLLVGDRPYYARFGFDRRATAGLWLPGPVEIDRFLGLDLRNGALNAATGPVLALDESRRGRHVADIAAATETGAIRAAA